ncbi:MAG TPA: type II secretion system protein [Verrucomicrobiae bacterium]|jgi:type II secretory pathway pseudopilin PulG|nr:type II secretion system protein [Verrucomicrobiae bacterium]
MKLATVQNRVGTARRAVTARTAGGTHAVERPTPTDCAAKRGADAAARRPYQSAFTLAETLAALVFMAILIPAVVEALHVASGAGEIAVRKGEAAHVADRVLNQSLVMTNWSTGAQNGVTDVGSDEFHWTLKSQNWPQDTMQLLTATVSFSTQGHDYSVELSTLANLQSQATPAGTQGKMP